MIKKVSSILFILFLTIVSPAYAHVLKTDGSIGAVLHVDPEDNPIAKQPSNFYFAIKDTTGKFDPANCICSVTITANDKQILLADLGTTQKSGDSYSSFLTFTFPEKDVYEVKVSGRPTDNSFLPFSLVYDVRVEKEAERVTPLPTKQFPYYFVSLLVVGGIFFGFLFARYKRK